MGSRTYYKKHEKVQSNINNSHEEYLANRAKVVHCLPITIELSIQWLPCRSTWRDRGLHHVNRNAADHSHSGGNVS